MGALEIPFCMVAVLLSLVSTGAIAQEYTFRADSFPLPYYYQEGSDVKVSCRHNSSLQFQYWIHPTNGNISVSKGKATLETKYGDVTLRLSNAGQADNGNYFCVCSFGALSLTSNAISASLQLPIKVHTNSTNITIGVGESHKFSCNASNIVQLQWFYFSSPNVLSTVLANTSDGKIEITHNHDLQLRHVELKDSGLYECALMNNLMRVRVHHILRVVGNTSEIVLRTTSSTTVGNNSPHYYFYIVIGIAALFCLLIISVTSIFGVCVYVKLSMKKCRPISGMSIHGDRDVHQQKELDLSNCQQLPPQQVHKNMVPTWISPNNYVTLSNKVTKDHPSAHHKTLPYSTRNTLPPPSPSLHDYSPHHSPTASHLSILTQALQFPQSKYH